MFSSSTHTIKHWSHHRFSQHMVAPTIQPYLGYSNTLQVDALGCSHQFTLLRPNTCKPSPVVFLMAGPDKLDYLELLHLARRCFLPRDFACVVANFVKPGNELPLNLFRSVAYTDLLLKRLWQQLEFQPFLDMQRVAVCGTKFGGHFALRCGALMPEVGAVINLFGPFDFSNIRYLEESVKQQVGQAFELNRDEQLQTLGRIDLDLATLPAPQKPILTIHQEQDELFPPSNGGRVEEWAGNHCDFWEIGQQQDFTQLLSHIGSWLCRQLPAPC